MTNTRKWPKPIRLGLVSLIVVAIIIVLPKGSIIPPGVIEAFLKANPGQSVQILPLSENQTVNVAPLPPPRLPDCQVIEPENGLWGTKSLSDALKGGTTKFILKTAAGAGLTILSFAGDNVTLASNFSRNENFRLTTLSRAEFENSLKQGNTVKSRVESSIRQAEASQSRTVYKMTKEEVFSHLGFREDCK